MKRFPEAFDGIPDAVLVVDTDGVVRAGNPRVEAVLGYDPATIEGTEVETLLHDPSGGSAGDELYGHVADPEPRSMAASIDLIARREDGSEVPVTVSLGPFEHEGEKYLVVTIVGVREMHARQAELHRRTQTLEALHEATQNLLKTTDREIAAAAAVDYIESVLDHPVAAIWLYDESEAALVPHAWTDGADDLIGDHPTFYASDRSISWQAFDDGAMEYVADTHADADRYNPDSPIRSELVLPLGRYGVINIGETAVDAFSESDRVVARIWAATVTMVLVRIERECQLKSREDEVSRERDRLEEFASLVSHDLRNPLNVAAGNLDLVRTELDREEGVPPEIDAVARSLDRMQALVDDMLTLARQGTAIDETETVSLSSLAQDCWASVDTADAELVVTGDLALRADRSRLRQALENLFANAVTHGGQRVRVEVGMLDDDGDAGGDDADEPGFYVADDGPGIPEELRAEAFDAGVSTDDDGTGFGLKIVAEVADAHGWSVALVDAPGGGARFEFRGVETVDAAAGDE